MEKYEKAGKIASKVRNNAIKHVHSGMKVIDLITEIEYDILKNGAKLAFPCNISINQIASHYTSNLEDNTILCGSDIVKIDLGTHIDGYPSDTSISIVVNDDDIEYDGIKMPGRLPNDRIIDDDEINKRIKLVESTENALENVISIIKEGVSLNDIGKCINDSITDYGFTTIKGLSGHNIKRYRLHGGTSIPNYPNKDNYKLEEGDCIAVEPFASDGVGLVENMNRHYIYKYIRPRPLRELESQKLLETITLKKSHFPFSMRHLLEYMDKEELKTAIKPLISSRAIFPYKVVKEKTDGLVAHSEHTLIIEKDGCKVTTE